MPNLNSCYWVNCPFKEIEWKWKGKKTQSFVAIDWLSAWDNLIDICGRSLMIHSSTAEHKLMWKVFTASTWISLFTNIQVINVTEIYYTLVSLLSYFYDIWGLFYCNFILLEENEIFFVNQHTFNFMYSTYSEFLVVSSDYITWISPPIGLYWLVVRCQMSLEYQCPLNLVSFNQKYSM